MSDVLIAVATMSVVVGAGWLIQARGRLPGGSREMLASVVFAVAGPCLLLGTVARADVSQLASLGAAVTWGTTLVLAALLAVIARWGLRLRSGRATMTVLSGAYVNAGNLGIPFAVYLFDDALAVVPTMLIQLLVMGPVAFTILDRAADTMPVPAQGRRSGSASVDAGTGTPRHRTPLASAVRNPLTVGALLGLALAMIPWTVPEAVLAPFDLVGAAAPPLALLTLGMSLVGTRVAQDPAAESTRAGTVTGPLVLAVIARSAVHPLLAWAVGAAVGLDGTPLAIVVAMAALPTAQNVVVFANRYGCAVDLASRACLVTTALCAPVLIVIAATLL